MNLRPMTEADLPAVMAIERATFPLDAWSEGMMRGELADMPRTRHYVVVSVDDEIVAYAGLAAAADQADVQTIAVLEKHQGTGLGSAMLTELLAEATAAARARSSWKYAPTIPTRRRSTGISGSRRSAPAAATTTTAPTRS